MKFLVEFAACCRIPPLARQRPEDDTRLRHRRLEGKANAHGWRPSLSSISEDVLTAQKNKNAKRPPAKRNVASASRRDRPRSSNHDDYRRANISTPMPTFSPVPFVF